MRQRRELDNTDKEDQQMERIFTEQMADLYWLAYLITGDRERSVEAFTGALNGEAHPPALQRFMRSWARRLVIVAALGTIHRQLRESALRTRTATREELRGLSRLASADLASLSKQDIEEVLLAMDVFQRCAVILTLLEGLPVKEAADLLSVEQDTVKAALARGVAEMTWRMAGVFQPVVRTGFTVRRVMLACG
jgi:DNA-directed RNA polymerase specialized sigma24 family protein